jgi:acyl-CoA thioesterase-1
MPVTLRLPIFIVLIVASFAAHATQTILVFGDSLSAGYGLAREQSWPSLLEQRLQGAHLPYTVVNASIGGETTAGGRTRLPAALSTHKPAIVVIALGSNDGLRGLSLVQMRDNLTAMVRAAKRPNCKVLLIGMKLPPNFGPDYTAEFAHSFELVARVQKVELLSFLLEPIAADPAAFQADNLHPVAEAEPKILEHVWKALKPLL